MAQWANTKAGAVRFLATLSLVWLSPALSWAVADQPHQMESQVLLAQRNCLSLSEAIKQVRRRYDRIVSAETRVSGNREVHHIKAMTKNGKVKTELIRGCKLPPT